MCPLNFNQSPDKHAGIISIFTHGIEVNVTAAHSDKKETQFIAAS